VKRLRFSWPSIDAPSSAQAPARWYVRLFWLAAIWAASVLALLAVGGLLRLVLRN
jgi:hypothetical protein